MRKVYQIMSGDKEVYRGSKSAVKRKIAMLLRHKDVEAYNARQKKFVYEVWTTTVQGGAEGEWKFVSSGAAFVLKNNH